MALCSLGIFLLLSTQNKKAAQNNEVEEVVRRISMGQGPQFRRIFPHPTGKNGLEDYVKACDFLQVQGASAYEIWLANLKAAGSKKDSSATCPPGIKPTDSYAVAERKYVHLFQAVLNFVRSGNSKPADLFLPTSGGIEERAPAAVTDFPITSRYQQLSKFMVHSANVDFQDGNDSRSSETLLNCLKFSRRIEPGSFISLFVGYACEGIAFRGFTSHLNQLSPRELEMVADYCVDSLSSKSVEIGVVKEQARLGESTTNEVFRELQRTKSLDGFDLPKPLVERFKSLSSSEINLIQNQVRDRQAARFNQTVQGLKGPESGWSHLDTGNSRPPSDSLVAALSSTFTFNADTQADFLRACIRRREGLHLLLLKARVTRYWRSHRRLPNDLSQCATPTEIVDPFTGKRYKLALQAGWFDIQT